MLPIIFFSLSSDMETVWSADISSLRLQFCIHYVVSTTPLEKLSTNMDVSHASGL